MRLIKWEDIYRYIFLYFLNFKNYFYYFVSLGYFRAFRDHFQEIMAASPNTPIHVGEETSKRPGKQIRYHRFERDSKKRGILLRKKLDTIMKACLELHVQCGVPVLFRSTTPKGRDCCFMSPHAASLFASQEPIPTVAELEEFYAHRLHWSENEKDTIEEKRRAGREIRERLAYARVTESREACGRSFGVADLVETNRGTDPVADLISSITGPKPRYKSFESVFGDVDDDDESSDEEV